MKGVVSPRVALGLAVALFVVLLLGELRPLDGAASAASISGPPPKLTIDEAPLNRDLRAPISFAPVMEKVAPSVVNIYSKTVVNERQSDNPLLNDPFLRRFFGDQFGQREPGQREPKSREHKTQSLGSGVIVQVISIHA